MLKTITLVPKSNNTSMKNVSSVQLVKMQMQKDSARCTSPKHLTKVEMRDSYDLRLFVIIGVCNSKAKSVTQNSAQR